MLNGMIEKAASFCADAPLMVREDSAEYLTS